jgi:hypothetical protein
MQHLFCAALRCEELEAISVERQVAGCDHNGAVILVPCSIEVQ